MVHTCKTDAEFKAALGKAKGTPVLIDFYADWCGPCRQIAPEVEKLATAHPNVTFLKVDVDNCREASKTYEIQAMPTFVALDGSQKEVERIKGVQFCLIALDVLK